MVATHSAHAATQKLMWHSCPPSPQGLPDAGMECTSMNVPLNYQQPNGKQITVAVSRIKATDPTKRHGVLFTNPGGPGGAGLDLPRAFKILMPQSIFDEYDVIGIDPRFIGESTPITCGLSAQDATQAFVPLEQNSNFASTSAFMKKVADGCAANAGDKLPYATTANTARDFDMVRQALGEQKISYFGYSYGTYLGAVYSSLFPNNTDRIVLDSSVDPGEVWRQQFRSWGPAGELRFPDFLKFAAANDATYHLGNTQGKVRQTYFGLMNKVNQSPVTLADGTVLNGPMFQEVTFGGLYNDNQFNGLAALWQFLNGNTGPSVKNQMLQPSDAAVDNEAAGGLAIACDDVAWSTSPAQYQLEYNLDSKLFPSFGALGSNIWPCAFWHNSPAEPPVAISSHGPTNILMLQNLRDPATSYWGALGMHAALGSRSRMVSVDQGGHTVAYLQPNACGTAAATDYLVSGTLPTTDKFCPAQQSLIHPLTPNAQTDKDKAMRELQKLVK
ncbi:MAG TPA: alpha/beta hydrolase [Candidatus Saccharimonas sp.]|nr:alpha/beta hydrolase [Candidatus Saccharimonas sp.]